MPFLLTLASLVALSLAFAGPSAVLAQSPAEGSVSPRQAEMERMRAPAPSQHISLFRDFARQQKAIWSFPSRIGEHLGPVLALTAGTAALVTLDPYVAPYFEGHRFDRFKRGIFTKRAMAVPIALAPALGVVSGLARHDQHATSSGLLATEALADALLLSTAMKAMSGRIFPVHVVDGDFRRTWFRYTGPAHDAGSFPSGHAMSAFAVAAVYSTRYKQHRWAPYVAYGLAAFISATRITDQTHFPSDVFAGAALGYAVGKYVATPR